MSKFIGLSLLACNVLVYGIETPYRADTAVEPVSQSATPTNAADKNTVYIKKINISGNVRVAKNVLQKTVKEDEERTYTYDKLEELLNKINHKYKSLGFEKARAVILEQTVKNATLNIYITTDPELTITPIKLLLPKKQQYDITVQKTEQLQSDAKKPLPESSSETTLPPEIPVALIVPKEEIKPPPLPKIKAQTLKSEPITIGSLLDEQIPKKEKSEVVPRDALPPAASVPAPAQPTHANGRIEKPAVAYDPTRAEKSKPFHDPLLQESGMESIHPSEEKAQSSFSLSNVLLFATNALLLVLSIGFVF